MNEFLTWDFLGSFAGAVAAIGLLTQLAKRYVAIDPKWMALVFSVFVGVALQLFYWQDFTAAGWTMTFFNICVLLTSAIGGYEIVKKQK